jgi:hypothetical protein
MGVVPTTATDGLASSTLSQVIHREENHLRAAISKILGINDFETFVCFLLNLIPKVGD